MLSLLQNFSARNISEVIADFVSHEVFMGSLNTVLGSKHMLLGIMKYIHKSANLNNTSVTTVHNFLLLSFH